MNSGSNFVKKNTTDPPYPHWVCICVLQVCVFMCCVYVLYMCVFCVCVYMFVCMVVCVFCVCVNICVHICVFCMCMYVCVCVFKGSEKGKPMRKCRANFFLRFILIHVCIYVCSGVLRVLGEGVYYL